MYCPYCMSPIAPGHPCPGCGKDPTSYQPESHHFPIGQLLNDRYYIGRALGEGGFGITYLGFDTKLERRVAIKEYFPRALVRREVALTLNVTCYTGSTDYFERGREQFLQEARTLAKLDDISEIVQVLDFFPANNSAYIVMEFLEGTTLKDLVNQRGGRLPAEELFALLEPVLRGMEAMHAAGLIHRDISPDNLILLKKGNRVKLMDFGCAREIDGGQTMTVMLKPGFAPVEQYTGHEQGPWTDVYALSATMYYCLTGTVPPEALRRSGADTLLLPSALGVSLSDSQERALLKGLAVDATNRWQSAVALYTGLYGKTPEGVLVADFSDNGVPPVSAPSVAPIQPDYEIGATTVLTQNEYIPSAQKRKQPSAAPAPKKQRSMPLFVKIAAVAVPCLIIAVVLLLLLGKNAPKNLPAGSPGTTQGTTVESAPTSTQTSADSNAETSGTKKPSAAATTTTTTTTTTTVPTTEATTVGSMGIIGDTITNAPTETPTESSTEAIITTTYPEITPPILQPDDTPSQEDTP